MSNPNGKLNALLRLCCVITRADPDIASQSSKFDQRTIVTNAVALISGFVLAALLWGACLASLLSTWAAVSLGMLIALFIFLIDQSICAGDWELRGVLRERASFSIHYLGRLIRRGTVLALRITLAGVLSLTTGMYATLWWFGAAIDNHLQAERSVQNARLEQEYAGLKADLASRLLSRAETELKATNEERASVQRRTQEALSARDKAAKRASAARIEMEREEQGLERAKGRGARFHDAQSQEQEANHLLSIAQDNLGADQARFRELEARFVQLNLTLEARNKDFQTQSLALDEKLKHDPRFIPERNDFLMRHQALEKIKTDPAYGRTATYISWLTTLTLVTLEMAFFLITQVAAPASVYTLRLIARTRLEAQQVDAEFVRNTRNLDGLQCDVPAATQTDTVAGVQDPPGHRDDNRTMDDTACTASPTEAPLFDPPSAPQTNNDPSMPDRQRTAPRDVAEMERYEVIGGAPGERVSIAEARANPDRYWVNGDRPSEIWDKRHREALLEPSYDKAA
jgi:hypothetical protein